MKTSDQLSSPPIEPVYSQSTTNSTIDFGHVDVLLESGDDSGNPPTQATVELRFSPNPRLSFQVPNEDLRASAKDIVDAYSKLKAESTVLSFPTFGTSMKAYCTSSSSEFARYVPKRTPVCLRPRSKSIKSVIFHLFNWPDFYGPENYVLLTGTPPLQGGRSCGRFSLKVDGWKVTVAATERTSESCLTLRESGGYIITHVGSIEREGGEEFSDSDLTELLTCLCYFFSFTLGQWSSLALPVGLDGMGNRVFEQWGMGRIGMGAWEGSHSWFDVQHSNLFSAVLPGFRDRWNNELWRRPLTEVIYWYISANQVGSGIGVDSALLFTQAALELLAWNYCVQDKRMVSESAFKPRGLSAANKLRLLVSNLDIPTEIPANLSALHSKRGKQWEDSMDAITDLRNGLVHPGKQPDIPDGAYYDAWRLSMWYIELVLLRLFRHNGNYANRLAKRWVGEVEKVPWAHSVTN